MRSMPGNPYDGHTLAETLEQMGILTGTNRPPATAIVDKGYRGVEIILWEVCCPPSTLHTQMVNSYRPVQASSWEENGWVRCAHR